MDRTRPIATTSIARPATRRREVEGEGLTWLDLPQPVSSDIAYLRERLRLDPLALDDVLSTIQRPKLDVHDSQSYLFLIAHVPVFNRDNRVIINQVGIFAGSDFVVTIHDGNLKPLRRLFAAAATDEAVRKQLLARGPGYLLYRVLDTLIKQSFPLVYKVGEDLAQLEVQLFAQPARTLVQAQALLERDLIALRYIVEPNLAVCDQLRTLQLPFLRIDTARFFGDTADGAHKLYDLIAEQRDAIASAGGTLATLSMQQPSASQRIMVIALLVLAPLVLLAALAVLALVAPPREQPLVFGAALLATAAVIGGLLAAGRAQRWF